MEKCHKELHKDFLDLEQGALQVVMFKVRNKGASKMHFRCVLRCAIALFFSTSLYLERGMQYLKFGLVFDLNFFHKLNLYQVNKTLLKLHFHCLIYPPYLLPLSTLWN